MEEGNITLIWKIGNFDMGNYGEGKYINSTVYKLESLHGSMWILQIGTYMNGYEYFKIYRCKQEQSQEINLSFSLSIIGKHNKPLPICRTKDTTFHNETLLAFSVKNFEIFRNGSLYWPENVLTIRCDLREKLLYGQPNVTYTAKTEIVTSKFSFLWTIGNVFEIARSPTLNVNNNSHGISYLGHTNQGYGFDVSGSPRGLHCKMFFTRSNGVRISPTDYTLCSRLNGDEKFENNTTLYVDDESIVTGNAIFLSCKCRISNGLYISYAALLDENTETQDASQLTQGSSLSVDVYRMYTENILSDYCILARNGEKFNVHSAVLAARSPVFQALFESDMVEKETKIIDISDVESGTMNLFLAFIYGKDLQNIQFDDAQKLYQLADKYQIVRLKEQCSVVVVSSLSVSNVVDVLVMAELHADHKMKTAAYDFIFANRNKVLASDTWKMFLESNMEAVNGIFLHMSMRMAED